METLAASSGMKVRDLINKQSQVYKKINPPIDEMDDTAILTLLQEYPRIMYRPLLIGPNSFFLKGFKADEYTSRLK